MSNVAVVKRLRLFYGIKRELIILAANPEKNLLCVFAALLPELFFEPYFVQALTAEVVADDSAVHNHLGADVLQLGCDIDVLGIQRPLGADRQN